MRMNTDVSRTSLLRPLLGLGQTDLNSEVTVLMGLNVIYITVVEII